MALSLVSRDGINPSFYRWSYPWFFRDLRVLEMVQALVFRDLRVLEMVLALVLEMVLSLVWLAHMAWHCLRLPAPRTSQLGVGEGGGGVLISLLC